MNRMIKSKDIRWEGHASHMEDKRNAYNVLVGKKKWTTRNT
jgi:hypothetical protein